MSITREVSTIQNSKILQIPFHLSPPASAHFSGPLRRPRTSTETHGVLRSIGLAPRARPARPLRPAADGERVARGAGSGVDARSLAAR